jgi:gamma-tubulin complex component 2
MLPLCNHHDYI